MAWEIFCDAVAPPRLRCAICGGEVPDWQVPLCPVCVGMIPFLSSPYCKRCGLPLLGAAGKKEEKRETKLCLACRTGKRAHYHLVRSLCIYEGAIREHLHAFKYRQQLAVGQALACLMAQGVEAYPELYRSHAVIPVPLTPERLKERGFNQAAIFADKISKYMHRPLWLDLLWRRVGKGSQTGLGKRARQLQVKGAFSVTAPERVRGRRVLLIDDVYTTGATADAAASALTRAGASEVYVYTLARTIMNREDGEGDYAAQELYPVW